MDAAVGLGSIGLKGPAQPCDCGRPGDFLSKTAEATLTPLRSNDNLVGFLYRSLAVSQLINFGDTPRSLRVAVAVAPKLGVVEKKARRFSWYHLRGHITNLSCRKRSDRKVGTLPLFAADSGPRC